MSPALLNFWGDILVTPTQIILYHWCEGWSGLQGSRKGATLVGFNYAAVRKELVSQIMRGCAQDYKVDLQKEPAVCGFLLLCGTFMFKPQSIFPTTSKKFKLDVPKISYYCLTVTPAVLFPQLLTCDWACRKRDEGSHHQPHTASASQVRHHLHCSEQVQLCQTVLKWL